MLPQRKGPWCPLNRMLGRHWVRSGGCGLKHNKRLLPGIEQRSLGRPNHSLFPILTELHRIPLIKVNNWGILIQKRCKWKFSVYARVLCSVLWRLFRSKLSRYGRLQQQRMSPGTAEQFNLILIGFFDIKCVSQQPLIWRRCETVCLYLYMHTDRIRP